MQYQSINEEDLTSSPHDNHDAFGPRRKVSRSTCIAFSVWTLLFWGASGVFAAMFYVGKLDFLTSTKTSLYCISVWLNGCLIPLVLPRNKNRPRLEVYHECLALWLISYGMTNVLWEIPWLLTSPFIFHDIHTLDDVLNHTSWMREDVSHMYLWSVASFSSVDLRTINQNSTFYTLELYAFVNIISIISFFRLNRHRSGLRYLVPVLGCGEPVASTFIFSMSEVYGGFKNMSGGTADTLLALLWTQYQYIVYPLLFGFLGYKLLLADWQYSHSPRKLIA
eukprot:m.42455 g.42455  ORF g.42455 m.42455 type:complete len:279 (+) comp19109_c0_seq1:114-950(+)